MRLAGDVHEKIGTTCTGVVKLIVESRRARVSNRLVHEEAALSRRHKRKRRLVIGKRRYSIAGGRTAKVRIRLTRKGGVCCAAPRGPGSE